MIPSLLADVCLMALAKDPAHRFANADEYAEALTDALSQIESTVPRPVAPGSVKCPTCGAGNAAGQKFCGECGNAIKEGAAKVSIRADGEGVPASFAPKLGESEAPASASKVPVEPGTGKRSILVDRKLAQFPLEFVGREDDILWLEDRLNDPKTSLVGARIVGDVGMGKSRLLGEFLEKVQEDGHVVVKVGPDPAWAEVGYHALRFAIVKLAELPEGGGTTKEWGTASAEARRGLADIFEHAGRGDLSSDELRYAVAEALRWAIVKASERGGRDPRKKVVLAVDDLHAIDGASRTAFADAVGEPPLVPSLLVVSYPPGHDPGWPASTASARVLMGLAPGLVSKLLQGTSKPSSSIGGRGIAPLYVDQLLRFSKEQGGRAPTRLADLIALRVERLPPDARRVLQAVAVYGDNADEGVIGTMVTEGTDREGATKSLVEAGMIESREANGKPTYRSAHPLIRDVVLATIPAAVRRGLHATCAEVGETNGMPLEARALHEYSAQNTFQALILLEQVAGRASARGDLNGSIGALRRCLDLARRELFRGELDDPMRAVLIFARKLGEALTAAGHFTDAEGVLREALDMAGPSGSDRARVLGALAQVSAIRDRNDEAHRYLLEALELAFASGAHELLHSLEDLKKSIAS
jgi:serine/threonine-protein kinase